jgi:MFS family permease
MRAFWWLTGATAVSTAGNTFLYLAVPLALIHTTTSSLLAVLAMAALTAPYLAAPVLGALIDRHDRRVTFVVGDLTQAGAVAVIPLMLALGQVGAVFVALCFAGLAKVVSDLSNDYGLIPALVPRARLDQAASWFNALQLVARFSGPALAGVTIAAVGTTWALLIDSATFLVTCCTVFFIPKTTSGTRESSITTMLRAGIGYFRSRPDLQRLTAALALYNLGAGALEPTLLTVGATQWSWSSPALGVAVSAGAVAASIGAAVSPLVRAGGRRQRRIAVWLAVITAGACCLLVSVPLGVVAGFCVLCFGEGGVNAATMAYRQQEIPPELSARVNAVIRTFITGAVPVSALLLGMTVNLTGSLRVFFPVAVTAVLAVVVWNVRAGRTVAPAPAEPVAVAERTAS